MPRSFTSLVAIVVVIGYLAFEVSNLHRMRYRMEPLFVYREFLSADRAATRCGAPPEAERARFLRNLEAVTAKALAELETRMPDAPATELDASLEAIRRDQVDIVDAAIAADGCKANAVWRWSKLHEQRARLNLRP